MVDDTNENGPGATSAYPPGSSSPWRPVGPPPTGPWAPPTGAPLGPPVAGPLRSAPSATGPMPEEGGVRRGSRRTLAVAAGAALVGVLGGVAVGLVTRADGAEHPAGTGRGRLADTSATGTTPGAPTGGSGAAGPGTATDPGRGAFEPTAGGRRGGRGAFGDGARPAMPGGSGDSSSHGS